MCKKCAKNAKNLKQKDSEYKNTKKKSRVLVKCFVNSFRKNPPISARNVPNLPEMSLFEQRKKSKKRIAVSKLALQYVKLTAKMGKRI